MDFPSSHEVSERQLSRNPSEHVVLENSVSQLSEPAATDIAKHKIDTAALVEETYARFFAMKNNDERNNEAFSVLEEPESSNEFSLYQQHENAVVDSYLEMSHGVTRIPVVANYDGQHSEFVTNYLRSKYLREIGAPIEEDDRESELARSLNKMVSSQSGGVLAIRSPREPDKIIDSARRRELNTLLGLKLATSASGINLGEQRTPTGFENDKSLMSRISKLFSGPAFMKQNSQPVFTLNEEIANPIDHKLPQTQESEMDISLGSMTQSIKQAQPKVKPQASINTTPQSDSNKHNLQHQSKSLYSGSPPIEEFTIREINYLDEDANLTQRNHFNGGTKTSRGPSAKKPKLLDRKEDLERKGRAPPSTEREYQERADKSSHIIGEKPLSASMSHNLTPQRMRASFDLLNPQHPNRLPRIQINLLGSPTESASGTHNNTKPLVKNFVVPQQVKTHSRSESENNPSSRLGKLAFRDGNKENLLERHTEQTRYAPLQNRAAARIETDHEPLLNDSQANIDGISQLLRKQDLVIDLLLKGRQPAPVADQNATISLVEKLLTENQLLKQRVELLERCRTEDGERFERLESRLMLLEAKLAEQEARTATAKTPVLQTTFQSVLDGMKDSSVRGSVQTRMLSPKGTIPSYNIQNPMTRCGTYSSMIQSERFLGQSMLVRET